MRNLILLFKRAFWLIFFKKHSGVDFTTYQELVEQARLCGRSAGGRRADACGHTDSRHADARALLFRCVDC